MMSTPNEDWSALVMRKPDRPSVEWKPLGTFGTSGCKIGILQSEIWVVDSAEGLADLGDERAFTFVLRLLTFNITEVRKWLESRLAELGLEPSLIELFPFARLVVRAIESGGYWAEQSFRWLHEISLSESQRVAIIIALKEIESNKEFSQKLRHEAAKNRTRLERRE